MKCVAILFALAALSAMPCATNAINTYPQEAPPKTYAQSLIDGALAKHPEVATLAMHVTPPNAADNMIIASNFGRIGKKADEDDLRVIRTGKPNLEITKAGDRFGVELQLKDVSGDTIGALAITFPYKAGDDNGKLLKQAEKIRDELRRRISNTVNLMEPYPFDAKIPTNTYAQKLVDETMVKHPELLILAFHVTPPNSSDNVILASTIGRIGKKADEDDMNAIRTGKPNLEVNSTGKRFEVELVLQDLSGRTIGALSTVFAYKAGDDKAEFQKRAEQIRDELRRQIPSVAKLVEPAT